MARSSAVSGSKHHKQTRKGKVTLNMKYNCKITGIAPLLMNRFHEDAQESVSNSGGKAIRTKAELTPHDDAEQRLYTDISGKHPVMPGVNVLACIISAGRFLKAGKRQLSTMKESI